VCSTLVDNWIEEKQVRRCATVSQLVPHGQYERNTEADCLLACIFSSASIQRTHRPLTLHLEPLTHLHLVAKFEAVHGAMLNVALLVGVLMVGR
jgi:hypothetical protein